MSQIIKYNLRNDGLYDVVVTGVEIQEQAIELLDLNQTIDVDCSVIDPNSITGQQRKLIFALCNDIEAHTGQPRDYMRYLFMDYVCVLYDYDKGISLSDCTRIQASQIIEVTLDWIFHNDIPLNYKTSDLLKSDRAFLYWSTVNRNCVICGKHAELAHYHAVGRGRNRRKIDHIGNKVLALCPNHHREQHNIGMDSFNEKYKLHDSWVDVDKRLNRMLKGETNGNI